MTTAVASVRVYSTHYHVSESAHLMAHLEGIEKFRKMDERTYKTIYKALCNTIRGEIGITNLIGLMTATHNETGVKAVLIHSYPMEANSVNHYEQHIDENNNPYIEV